MSILDRVSDPEPGEEVAVRFIDGSTKVATYVQSNAALVMLADEGFQFTVPLTAILWVSKPLKEEA